MSGFYTCDYPVIISSDLLHDKRLTANEKMLYAELTTRRRRETYVTNEYLATICGVSPSTITRWLAKLQACGYISMTISKEEGNVRKIKINRMIEIG